MALSQQDMDLIQARAELIAEQVVERVVTRVLAAHIKSCPYGRTLYGGRWMLIGLAVGLAVVSVGSGAVGAMLFKLLL